MKLGFFIIALVFAVIFLAGCGQQNLVDSNSVPLASIEIRDYNGKNLSSVNDFRENSIKGPQYVNEADYKLEITGLVDQPQNYSYSDATSNFQSYEKIVTLDCVEGWSATILWQGVLVRDIIGRARPLPNVKTIIFHAYDGYTTSFPIEYIMGNDILMAYKMNGLQLPPERGFPFQLVAESKWGYKWIKWITKIELSDNADYRGYWESNGYSNSGDLDKSFIGD